MVKHTQTTRRLLPTKFLVAFDHFVKLALKGLRQYLNVYLKKFCRPFNIFVIKQTLKSSLHEKDIDKQSTVKQLRNKLKVNAF